MADFYNRNIPNAADAFIRQNIGAGISVMAFAPGGGWVGVAANGVYEARGIPQECFDKLESFQKSGWKVRSIAFPPEGGNSWVIVADQGYFARNIPQECFDKLESFQKSGWKVRSIAFPPEGGNSWVIIGTDHLFARGIDSECYQVLSNYMQGENRASGVAFAPGDGWTIFGTDPFFARRIDPDCYQQMQKIRAGGNMIDHVAFVPGGNGYSIIANQALPSTFSDPIRRFENEFYQDTPSSPWQSIQTRMAKHGVPGASVAFVQDNTVAWRTSYGVIESGTKEYVYSDTPFQAASISKSLTAVALLRLAQDGKVQLDDPVQKHTKPTSWTIPVRACGDPTWVNEATIALTLAHKGGFIGRGSTYPTDRCDNFTDNNGDGDYGGGFGGYPNDGRPLPTLDQILAGTNPPANSPKIELSTRPSSQFAYSGMGYVALMRMLQDVTGTNFADWMQSNVLTPLGMSGSIFAVTLPPQLSRAATGHAGIPLVAINGKRNRFPESSAAGLYSNAGDLCRLVIMLNACGTIDGANILTKQMCNRMLGYDNGKAADRLGLRPWPGEPQPGEPPEPFDYHDGVNLGFYALFRCYIRPSAGFAVMTNANAINSNSPLLGGAPFVKEAADALTRIYSLPTSGTAPACQ